MSWDSSQRVSTSAKLPQGKQWEREAVQRRGWSRTFSFWQQHKVTLAQRYWATSPWVFVTLSFQTNFLQINQFFVLDVLEELDWKCCKYLPRNLWFCIQSLQLFFPKCIFHHLWQQSFFLIEFLDSAFQRALDIRAVSLSLWDLDIQWEHWEQYCDLLNILYILQILLQCTELFRLAAVPCIFTTVMLCLLFRK